MLQDVPDSIRFCGLKELTICGSLGQARNVEKIPDWIKDLHQLEFLTITNCPKLASLPSLPASLLTLKVETCESLESIISMENFLVAISHVPSFLYFPNCFKLDETTRTVIANKSVKGYLPGSTIPAKFDQRALGNSLTIRSDFNLFQVCVMISPDQPMAECSLLCNIRINGSPNEKKIYQGGISMIDKEHLYMSYVVVSDEDEGWRAQDNEIMFEFSTTSPEVDITHCGVLDRQDHQPISRANKLSSEELYEDDDEDSDGRYKS